MSSLAPLSPTAQEAEYVNRTSSLLGSKRYDQAARTAQKGLNLRSASPEINAHFWYIKASALNGSDLPHGAFLAALKGLQCGPNLPSTIDILCGEVFRAINILDPNTALSSLLKLRREDLSGNPAISAVILDRAAQAFFAKGEAEVASRIREELEQCTPPLKRSRTDVGGSESTLDKPSSDTDSSRSRDY